MPIGREVITFLGAEILGVGCLGEGRSPARRLVHSIRFDSIRCRRISMISRGSLFRYPDHLPLLVSYSTVGYLPNRSADAMYMHMYMQESYLHTHRINIRKGETGTSLPASVLLWPASRLYCTQYILWNVKDGCTCMYMYDLLYDRLHQFPAEGNKVHRNKSSGIKIIGAERWWFLRSGRNNSESVTALLLK